MAADTPSGRQSVPELEHLANAPIREAVINIKCSGADDLERLKGICDDLSSGYPNIKNLRDKEVRIALPDIGQGELETLLDQHVGFRCESEDGKYIAQLRLDGLTLSRLTPYEEWEAFLSEFRRLWRHYTKELDELSISRISTRYINSIRLPTTNGVIDFDEYLVSGPQVPAGLPQSISTYQIRMQIPDEDGIHILLTQALEKPGDPTYASVLLDIDVLKDVTLSLENEDKVWECLFLLRDKKNDVFRRSVTDKAMELFR